MFSVYTMSVKYEFEEQPLETETDEETIVTNGNIQLLDIEEEDQRNKSLKTSRRWKRWKYSRRPRGSCWHSRLKSCIIVILGIVVFFVAILLSLTITLLLKEPSQPVYNGAVAADSSVCSSMGGQILEKGGSAVDAAITSMLCTGIVHAESSGIGGGGFMTVFDPSNQSVMCINFREKAPLNAAVDMFHGNTNLSKYGGLAVGVPGEVAGMKLAHDLYGRLPWADLFEPVIQLAINGYKLDPHNLEAIKSAESRLKVNDRFKSWYYHSDGTMKTEGELVRKPLFAEVLQQIATHGPSIFYNGSIAQEIVDEVQNNSGILILKDLQQYQPSLDVPLSVVFKDEYIFAPPLPSGGPELLFMLNVMDTLDLTRDDRWKNVTYQHLVETFKYGFAFRSYLGDPYCERCDTDTTLDLQSHLISESYAVFINKTINNTRTYGPSHYKSAYIPIDEGTTHINAVSPDGMAVAVTTTVNGFFGAQLITKSGIVLNNEMDDFSAPNITNLYGLPPFKSNFVEPGKRPLSSTCPSIVLKQDNNGEYYAHLVIGASGGTLIGTATTQVALRILAFQEGVAEAIEGERLHHQLYPDLLLYEDGYPKNITSYLASIGHTIKNKPIPAVVQGIVVDSTGNITAHSDSRKGGNPQAYILKS